MENLNGRAHTIAMRSSSRPRANRTLHSGRQPFYAVVSLSLNGIHRDHGGNVLGRSRQADQSVVETLEAAMGTSYRSLDDVYAPRTTGADRRVFVRQWLKKPIQIGAVLPSSLAPAEPDSITDDVFMALLPCCAHYGLQRTVLAPP